MMFGEVGGLNDFIALILSMVLGLFSDKFMQASIVQKMFRGFATAKSRNGKDSWFSQASKKRVKPLKFSTSFLVAEIFQLRCCVRDKI